ncbi:sensor histidine kinase [Mucilaginibacter gossypiicola]|nr:histidine kinase [Mucilaginibacter gossypiicola]
MIFALYEIGVVYITTGHFYRLADYVLFYILNIGLFYYNAYFVLPYSFAERDKSYLKAFMGIAAEIAIYLAVKLALDHLLDLERHIVRSYWEHAGKYLMLNLWRGLYFWSISTLYWSVARLIEYRQRDHIINQKRLAFEKEKAVLERDLVTAQNAYLHHQINPHFLFNSLSFIHNTFYEYSREAAKCVMLLSEIMHYTMLEPDSDGKKALRDELEQINNFITLNRYRFDFDLQLDIKITGEAEGCRIIPLVLLSLTENVFKHGNLKVPEKKASLSITISRHQELTFRSWNLKKNQTERRRIRSIGIENTIKRLEHSYPHQFKLNIHEEEESYELELKMQL